MVISGFLPSSLGSSINFMKKKKIKKKPKDMSSEISNILLNLTDII